MSKHSTAKQKKRKKEKIRLDCVPLPLPALLPIPVNEQQTSQSQIHHLTTRVLAASAQGWDGYFGPIFFPKKPHPNFQCAAACRHAAAC